MNLIRNVKVYRYSLPLLKTLPRQREVKNRQGLILRVQSEEGVGYGEVAPLAALHKESLQEAEENLIGFINKLFDVGWENHLRNAQLFNSVRFGIDCAILSLKQFDGYESKHQTIGMNGLIDADPIKAPLLAVSLVELGYKALKIKVGQYDLKDEIASIRQIRKVVGKKIKIRLDANRAFDLGDAVAFGQGIQKCQIQYVEEPLKNPVSLDEWFLETTVPYALDESLNEMKRSQVQKLKGFNAIILKPSAIGSIDELKIWMDFAKENQKKCIVTSAFESGVGLCLLSILASASHWQDEEMGLATSDWFKEDVMSPPFRPFRAQIDIAQCIRQLRAFDPDSSSHCTLLTSLQP